MCGATATVGQEHPSRDRSVRTAIKISESLGELRAATGDRLNFRGNSDQSLATDRQDWRGAPARWGGAGKPRSTRARAVLHRHRRIAGRRVHSGQASAGRLRQSAGARLMRRRAAAFLADRARIFLTIRHSCAQRRNRPRMCPSVSPGRPAGDVWRRSRSRPALTLTAFRPCSCESPQIAVPTPEVFPRAPRCPGRAFHAAGDMDDALPAEPEAWPGAHDRAG